MLRDAGRVEPADAAARGDSQTAVVRRRRPGLEPRLIVVVGRAQLPRLLVEQRFEVVKYQQTLRRGRRPHDEETVEKRIAVSRQQWPQHGHETLQEATQGGTVVSPPPDSR